MNIKIESDVFDIVNRIKDIDDGYYIVYNTKTSRLEIHNNKDKDTYCLTLPYDTLDNRTIDYVLMTSVDRVQDILEDIESTNIIIEKDMNKKRTDMIEYQLKEIYQYASNTSKDYIMSESYLNKWI